MWENLGPQSKYIDDDAQSEYIDDDEMNENYVDFFFPDLIRTLNACENDAEWTSHVKSYFLEQGSSTTCFPLLSGLVVCSLLLPLP